MASEIKDETAKQGDRKLKKKRPSFRERISARVGETKRLGDTLVNRPREFPKALLELMRHGFRDLWRLRGGGLYACGFIVTWVWLEIRMLIDDLASFTGIGDFLSGQLLQFLFRFTIDSFTNTIQAFMWPVHVVNLHPRYGAIALGLAFVVFPLVLKKPLEKWLFDDAENTEAKSGN